MISRNVRPRHGHGRSQPRVLYFNNDDFKAAGSKGSHPAAEMSATDRLRLLNSRLTVYLFEMTVNPNTNGLLKPTTGPAAFVGPVDVGVDALESMLCYARLPGATPEVARIFVERLFQTRRRATASQQLGSALCKAKADTASPCNGLFPYCCQC